MKYVIRCERGMASDEDAVVANPTRDGKLAHNALRFVPKAWLIG